MGLWDEAVAETGLRVIRDPLTRPRAGDAAVTIEMPGYCQTDTYSCGFVAGLMAVHALHPRRSATRFYAQVSPHPVLGTANTRLIKALRATGVSVSERYDLDFERLAAEIADGAPVVTTIATEQDDTWHWVTLYGVGWRPQRVYMAGASTPGLGRIFRDHEVPWPQFTWLWRPRGFGLVCRKR